MLYPDMNLQKRTQQNSTRYRTALYLRLSREDGDKTESDSMRIKGWLVSILTSQGIRKFINARKWCICSKIAKMVP